MGADPIDFPPCARRANLPGVIVECSTVLLSVKAKI